MNRYDPFKSGSTLMPGGAFRLMPFHLQEPQSDLIFAIEALLLDGRRQRKLYEHDPRSGELTGCALIGGPLHGLRYLAHPGINDFCFYVCPDRPETRYDVPCDELGSPIFSTTLPGVYGIYARAYHNNQQDHPNAVPFWWQGCVHSSRPDVFGVDATPRCLNPEIFLTQATG